MDKMDKPHTFDFEVWTRVNEALQGYADALDRADIDALLSHFDEDARWHYSPTTMRRGHAEIREFFDERLSVFAHTSHNVGPPVLRPGAETKQIESTAYFNAEHLLHDGTCYSVWGRYVDQLRLTERRALICQRTVMVHVTKGTDRAYTYVPRKSHESG